MGWERGARGLCVARRAPAGPQAASPARGRRARGLSEIGRWLTKGRRRDT
uniref:Uncharacterized protein n=1 Tax=Setaria viridis TaxID=4556 RepID=A0A4U6UC35_SETVI|nr:hypothetical protein SEVIR_6G243450v2 [Setaria viridis]